MDSENGDIFVKNLANFVRSHEKALANALQSRRQQSKPPNRKAGESMPNQHGQITTAHTIANILSLGTLRLTSSNVQATKLSLTPHHLYYLLCKIEEMDIAVGPMNIRLEDIHAEASPANYVSFLGQSQRSRSRSDGDSMHSISSIRSVVTSMAGNWSGFALGPTNVATKTERSQAQFLADLRYLYSAFTKVPCLRLAPNHRARLIAGFEEFPFDTAVPLLAFKNISALEINDVDFRQFYGWDRLADHLRSLTIKRGHVDDPSDVLESIVLDDMIKRRRHSSKAQSMTSLPWPLSTSVRSNGRSRAGSSPCSPFVERKMSQSTSPKHFLHFPYDNDYTTPSERIRTKSVSPARLDTTDNYLRTISPKFKRSGSGSSNSSIQSTLLPRSSSSSNLLTARLLPASKWSLLRHLSLADNSLTEINASSLAALAATLHSLDLSSNLFNQIPECLASLTNLRALNLSYCMIDTLRSLGRKPLARITALNLRANRLSSLAGIQTLLALERLDLRDNDIQDPVELARLTSIAAIQEIWVMHNPLVKAYNDYRITIFNLFRSTPGYTKDPEIDSSGPGYNERRHLHDRIVVFDQSQAQYGKGSLQQDSYSDTNYIMSDHTGIKGDTRIIGQERPPDAEIAHNEIAHGTRGRRKGPRRRIVDLASDQGTSISDLNDAQCPTIVRSITTGGVSASDAESSQSRPLSYSCEVKPQPPTQPT